MREFLFEDIKIHTAKNVDEMKKVFGSLIKEKDTKLISFINPEIFMQQQKNDALHKYFLETNYNFIDGIFLLKAINFKLNEKFTIENRYPGTDFFTYLRVIIKSCGLAKIA